TSCSGLASPAKGTPVAGSRLPTHCQPCSNGRKNSAPATGSSRRSTPSFAERQVTHPWLPAITTRTSGSQRRSASAARPETGITAAHTSSRSGDIGLFLQLGRHRRLGLAADGAKRFFAEPGDFSLQALAQFEQLLPIRLESLSVHDRLAIRSKGVNQRQTCK